MQKWRTRLRKQFLYWKQESKFFYLVSNTRCFGLFLLNFSKNETGLSNLKRTYFALRKIPRPYDFNAHTQTFRQGHDTYAMLTTFLNRQYLFYGDHFLISDITGYHKIKGNFYC